MIEQGWEQTSMVEEGMRTVEEDQLRSVLDHAFEKSYWVQLSNKHPAVVVVVAVVAVVVLQVVLTGVLISFR